MIGTNNNNKNNNNNNNIYLIFSNGCSLAHPERIDVIEVQHYAALVEPIECVGNHIPKAKLIGGECVGDSVEIEIEGGSAPWIVTFQQGSSRNSTTFFQPKSTLFQHVDHTSYKIISIKVSLLIIHFKTHTSHHLYIFFFFFLGCKL